MRRLLYLWLTLLGGYWIATTAVALALGARIEANDLSWLVVLAAPALQAVLLAWLTRANDAPRTFPDLPRGAARTTFAALLAADLGVGLLGGLFPEEPSLSFRASFGAPRIWAASQSIAVLVLMTKAFRMKQAAPCWRLLEWALGLALLAGLGAIAGWRLPPEISQPLYGAGWIAGLFAITTLGGAFWFASDTRAR